MSDAVRRLLRSPQGGLGLVLVAVVALAVVAGPELAPHAPEAMSPLARYRPPSPSNWFGTDQFGRDIFSRVLAGARDTVAMALIATLLGTLAGALLGTFSAFVGGRVDEALMRTNDAVMAIPNLLLALLIVSVLGRGSVNAVLAIAIAFAPGMARVARSVALTVRKQDYVAAAVARGEGAIHIVVAEMLPNVVAPIVIETTLRVSFAVMTFATLSFLGLGAQPPASEWGLMVAEARRFMHLSPSMLIFPCAAIALVAIGFNLLGDGLRDALNPRT
jgi:peptide/nickel transport system permease protein